MYPSKFEKMMQMFEKLPGVGSKTAQRYCFELLNHREELEELIEVIRSLGDIHICRCCGFLSDDELCPFCKDDSRDHTTIMVVGNHQDVVALEKTGTYKGLYHVLGGLLSSSKGIFPEDIGIDTLLQRLDGGVKEVILATSPTMDGEMTALYLDKILKEKNLLVTRLANGLPIGANLDYADELTLSKALSNRRKIGE